jgi:hypothetical protein
MTLNPNGISNLLRPVCAPGKKPSLRLSSTGNAVK